MPLRHGARAPTWTLPASLALCGCMVFDPALYQQQQQSGATTLADRCEMTASLPVVQPDGRRPLMVDTRNLADNYREFAGCVGNDLPGNDGFFSVTMRRGETWHFHVDTTAPDADPALYILPVCTTLQCSPTGAIDQCGPGRSEHFSFRPTADGAYLVGVDSKARGGAQYVLTVVRPTCGDGVVDHGEPCDDAHAQVGVTCERCHKVLAQPMASETGVANDDYTNAMALRPTGGMQMFPVTGTVGVCDTDMFDFDATAGQTLRATLTARSGACPAGLSLTLLRADAATGEAGLTAPPTAVAEAMVTTADNCPSLTLPRTAQAGTYFLAVTAQPPPAAEFAYVLTVDLRDAM